jgi:uncharacterized protein
MKLSIKVKPNSPKQKVSLIKENYYLVELKSPAEKNKANLELIKILSRFFRIPQKNIVIKAGLTNREKLVEVKNEIRKS